MKASTGGVYGAGIKNRKRKVKPENRGSKSERSPNSENRIRDWLVSFGVRTSFGVRVSEFGILPGVIIFFYLEARLI
jgi:hypothetical protein